MKESSMSYFITLHEVNLESVLIFNMILCLKVCKVNVSKMNQTFLLTWTLILEKCFFWRKNSNISSKLYLNTTFFERLFCHCQYISIYFNTSVHFLFPIKVRFWGPSITGLPNTDSVSPSLDSWNFLPQYNSTPSLKVQIQAPGSPFPPREWFSNSS